MKQYNKVCATCNKPFISSRPHTVFCSRLCHRRFPSNQQKYCDRTKKYQRKHAKEPLRRYQKLIYKAKHEHHMMDIPKEEYLKLIASPCEYCGHDLLHETGCGLDRLNNNLGYTTNNVVPCCGVCNQIKNIHLTHDEMKIAMTAILRYRSNDNNHG